MSEEQTTQPKPKPKPKKPAPVKSAVPGGWMAGAVIRYPGGSCTVTPGSDFKTVVTEAAKKAGLARFRVKVGKVEVAKPSEAPEKIEEGMLIDIVPYDEAGL